MHVGNRVRFNTSEFMIISNLRPDLRRVAGKYRAFYSPSNHASVLRNMPLDVAYKALADFNKVLRASRGAEIRASGLATGTYLVPRLRFRGPRNGVRPARRMGVSALFQMRWDEAQRASYCLKSEANRASLYLYEKVWC